MKMERSILDETGLSHTATGSLDGNFMVILTFSSLMNIGVTISQKIELNFCNKTGLAQNLFIIQNFCGDNNYSTLLRTVLCNFSRKSVRYVVFRSMYSSYENCFGQLSKTKKGRRGKSIEEFSVQKPFEFLFSNDYCSCNIFWMFPQ